MTRWRRWSASLILLWSANLSVSAHATFYLSAVLYPIESEPHDFRLQADRGLPGNLCCAFVCLSNLVQPLEHLLGAALCDASSRISEPNASITPYKRDGEQSERAGGGGGDARAGAGCRRRRAGGRPCTLAGEEEDDGPMIPGVMIKGNQERLKYFPVCSL